MKKLTKSLALVLALIMIFSMLVTSLVGCGGNDDTDTSTNTGSDTSSDTSSDTGTGDTNKPDGTVDYTVQIKTVGGMAVSGVTLKVTENGNIKDFGNTDKNGMITFTLPKSNNYIVSVHESPKGYSFQESYPLLLAGTTITTKTSVVENPDNELPSDPYKLGDVMYDFEVTTIEGKKIKLSEVLKTKKMVLLNFFYTECGPCATEFPFMTSAYEEYKDDIEIIAINPHPGSKETLENVKLYAATMELNFPVVKESYSWAAAFNVNNYPTNLIVDRDGMIVFREEGALTSQTIFNLLFDFFIADDYVQQIVTDMNQIAPQEKPSDDLKMDSSEDISSAINNGEVKVEYSEEDDEMAWPFVLKEDEKGNKYLFNSNSGKMNSYAQINLRVTLKRGQALAFDYMANTEKTEDYVDVLYVFAEGKDIYQISGVGTEWLTCYPYVAEADGEYEISLCYIKNESMDNDPLNDGVAIKNVRVVSATDIDVETYISRYAATDRNASGLGFNKYASIVLGDDGFYRVCQKDHDHASDCDKNGPYLLAELIGVTQFKEDTSITILMYDGVLNEEDSAKLLKYCNYASNSAFYGLCAVNEELKELLIKITDAVGFDEDPNEWMQICEYYSAYGTDKQIDNPIKGLGVISAFTATEGKDKPNSVTYDRPIMPRGLLYKFVPTKSGAYRITSNSTQEVQGWVFLDDKNTEYIHSDMGERLSYIYTGNDFKNCTMVGYFEEGKEYYIDIAYYDVYGVGTFTFTIDYIGESYEYFVVASPGHFTFEEGENFNPETLEGIGSTIAGGVDVMLGEDGYYYVKNKDGSRGSLLYADFHFPTNTFPTKTLQEIIKAGGFDLSKSDSDQTVIAYISSFEVQYIIDQLEKALEKAEFDELMKDDLLVDIINGKETSEDSELLASIEKYRQEYKADNNKAIDYFKTMWGDDFEENVAIYELYDVLNGKYHGKRSPSENDKLVLEKYEEYKEQFGDNWRQGFKTLWGANYESNYVTVYKVDEVLDGKYHGEAMDLTEKAEAYIDKMISDENELQGCVIVDKELAEILQALMDKFTFEGVEHSWTKLCYYYLHIGA